MNHSKRYLLSLLLIITACTRQQEQTQSGDIIPKVVEAKGYIVPRDSISEPVVVPVGTTTVVKVGTPEVITINTNIHPVGKPRVVKAGTPRACIPGQNGVSLPKTVPAIDQLPPGAQKLANELLSRVKTHLQLKHSKVILGETNKWLEKEVAQRTAELVAAKKELEEHDQVKTEFLNLLNHELLTPLNGILGGLSLIKGYDLPEEMGQFLDMLDVSAKRLEKFSYKALDISAMRAKGKNALNLKENYLVEILHEAMADMTIIAKNKNISLNLACFKDIMPVLADKIKIRNTIFYVIENAICFSDPGSLVHVIAKVEENQIVCLVKDQGTGFSDYALQQLFKPFSNTKHHVDANAGLSLYYSKLVMDAHYGVISVEKNKPNGSVVKITLPLCTKA